MSGRERHLMSASKDPSDADELEPRTDDERWLLARTTGAPPPPLPPERAASYERLLQRLRNREQVSAPASVRDRLRLALDAAETRQRERSGRGGWWVAVAAAVLALAGVIATVCVARH